MTNARKATSATASLVAIALLGVPACAMEKPATEPRLSQTLDVTVPPMTATTPADPAADLFGPGCAEYTALHPSGPASVTGMAQDPVATATANNPLLSTLTAALSGKLNPNVNLVDTLNNGQYTVFAPTDAAFDKLPAATIDALRTDSQQLISVLTYHLVKGQHSPAQVGGLRPTLQGSYVTVMSNGDGLTVDDARLVCGGIHTANATVYLIDTVLMPTIR